LSSEPSFLVQEKSTIAITVELDTFVVVVKLKISPPPSDYQVRRCYVFAAHGAVVRLGCLLVLARGVVVRCARLRVNCGCFPCILRCCFFCFTLVLCKKGVGTIKVATEIIADNWRFFELRLCANVSLIVLVVLHARKICLPFVPVTIVVAVTQPGSVKTSSLTAVVVPFVGEVGSSGVTVLS